jgi:hypothetical protein
VIMCALACWPGAASAACEQNWSQWAHTKKDVNWGWAPGVGLRSYSVSIASYLRRCNGKSLIRHGLYWDTRNFPWGYTFMFAVSTRRSDGVWRRVKKDGAGIFSFEGRQKIQEILLGQTRYTPGRTAITRVEVRHCACSPASGAIPKSSTLKGTYELFNGPYASPKSG